MGIFVNKLPWKDQTMSRSWYALHSKPNKEQFLYSQLLHRQIDVYYPRLHVDPVNPRSRKMRPFFPGYLFVHVDLEKTPHSTLSYIPGATDLVSFDFKPATIPDEVIDGIKKNVNLINNQQKKFKQSLKHGDEVIIQGGPFDGYQAIFDTSLPGSERVRVLISLMRDRQVRIQIPDEMVKPKNRKS